MPEASILKGVRGAFAAGTACLALAASVQPAAAQFPYYYGRIFETFRYGAPYVPPGRIPGLGANRGPRQSAQPRKPEPRKDFGEIPKGPLQIVVSIADQHVTLYSNGVRVAQGPVSTGVPGRPTPTGVFSVIQKDRYHRSNLYSNAPMPYMQRITWSGVALHEGPLPGHPASHGCIRMTHDFAARLWVITRLGVRVIVARNEVVPTDFAHPRLFAPKAKPADPPVAGNEPDKHAELARVQLAQAASRTPAAEMSDVPPASLRGTIGIAPSSDESADAISAAAPNPGKQTESTLAAEPARDAEPAPHPDPVQKAEPVQQVEPVQQTDPIQQAAPADFVQPVQQAEPAKPANPAEEAGRAQAEQPVRATPAALEPRMSDPEKSELGIADPDKFPPLNGKADQPEKRSGHVAVFVSRKTKKIYVRQGFGPVFDMPVEIADPEQPLGTHVFTALGLTGGGASMRWNVMSMPPEQPRLVERLGRNGKVLRRELISASARAPSTPAEALDRIQIPQVALDRIGEILVPGSSLVISDQGLGGETGLETDFIVLTH